MKCRNCGRQIEDNSIFCNWCGKRQIKEKYRDKDEISVPEPVKLASGNYRIQLRREGINIVRPAYEQCKEDARAARRKWLELHADDPESLSLGNAIDRYISSKDSLLSPSTVRAYKRYRDLYFQDCMDWDIHDKHLQWQAAINKEFKKGRSAKTVFNSWHLCTAAMNAAGVTPPTVTLPKSAKKERNFLNYEEVNTFLSAVREKPCELPALLALNSLRLSELLALRPTSISPDCKTLFVRGSRVLNSDNILVYKELNKTDGSRRDVPVVIPRLTELLQNVPQAEFIYDGNRKLYFQINKVCRDAGLPEVGVHGLRHSFASLAYHLGWKELSTMQVGGWSSSRIVHEIYTHNADLYTDVEKMREHFQTEITHQLLTPDEEEQTES